MVVIKTTALFVLVCLSFSAAEIRKTFNKHGSTESVDTVHSGDLDQNLLAEIKCENTTKSSKPTKCQVSQETLDGKYKAVTCEVELDNYVGDGDVFLYNLDKDKVIIRWWSESEDIEHQFIRHSIVHLSECKVVEANINQTARDYSGLSWDDLRGAFLNRGNGAFDVFYYTEDTTVIRRVTFDAQGSIVAEPIDSFDITQDFQSLKVAPTSKKNLHMAILQYANDTQEFTLFGDDGSWDVIKSFGDRYKNFAASGDHDTIRLCSLKEKRAEIVCKTFNSNEKSTTTIKFNGVDVDYVQNLANDEFLLLTNNPKTINITKYGADGKQQGKLELLTPECKDDSDTEVQSIFYSNGDEECVAQLCSYEKGFDVINYCFKNQDFK